MQIVGALSLLVAVGWAINRPSREPKLDHRFISTNELMKRALNKTEPWPWRSRLRHWLGAW